MNGDFEKNILSVLVFTNSFTFEPNGHLSVEKTTYVNVLAKILRITSFFCHEKSFLLVETTFTILYLLFSLNDFILLNFSQQ